MLGLIGVFVKRITGARNIPKGGCILVMNHASYIDGPLVQYVVRRTLGRKVYFLQSREWLLRHWWLWPFFVWLLGQIPTNGSVAKVLEKLRDSQLIGLFPEAARSRTGAMQKVKHSGLAVLAVESGVPVVPVGLGNTFEFWPAHKTFPSFQKILTVSIGKPLRFKKQKLTKKNKIAIIRKVMRAVAKLANEDYRW